MSESSEITPLSEPVAHTLTSLRYLRSKFNAKAEALSEMATKEAGQEAARLRAKASGLLLAVSYLDDEFRAQREHGESIEP